MFENEENETIDLKEIIQIVKKYIVLIMVVPVVFAIIGAIVSIYLIDPVYESSTTLIVNQNNNSTEAINKGDVDLSKSLIYTYAEMAKSNTVLDNTKNRLNIDSIGADTISVSPVRDTQILKIAVRNNDPILATDIANTLVEEFTLEIARITKSENVAVVDFAKVPKNPIKPNKLMNTVIAGMLGGMLILFVVFLKEYLDNTIKTERDIEKYLGISIIGTIPNFNQGSKQVNGKVYSDKKSEIPDNGVLQENCSEY